jgi:hypothetical protein
MAGSLVNRGEDEEPSASESPKAGTLPRIRQGEEEGQSQGGFPKAGFLPRSEEEEILEMNTLRLTGHGLTGSGGGNCLEIRGSGQEDKNRAARCLDSILTTNGQFTGKNVTKYLKLYESKMRVNLVDVRLAVESFITLVGESLHPVVSEIIEKAAGDWAVDSSRMKREFFVEDADRLTRTSFLWWVQDKTRTLGPME